MELVRPEHVAEVWPLCAGFLARALAVSEGEYALDDLREAVTSGRAMLVVHQRAERIVGCAVVQVAETPQKRLLHVLAMGGRRIVHAENYEALCRLGRSLGCSAVQCMCRAGQARLYSRVGMTPRYYVVRGDL